MRKLFQSIQTKPVARCFAVLSVSLLLAGVILLVHFWPRLSLFREGGVYYQRYREKEGYKTVFVKDLRVNDSVTVDVTVITAKDSVAWEALQRDFGIPEEFIEANRIITEEKKALISFRCKKGQPGMRVTRSYEAFDEVFYSTLEPTMYIYDIEEKNKNHTFDINHYEVEKTFNN